MARFYTALATGGEAARPQVVAGNPERQRIFTLTPEQRDGLTRAMEGVVSARGTAGSAALKGFAGKTGSAQNAQDPNADHAWFVGFAPSDNPTVVVAVMIEYGLHGYRAARIAKAITEHYLHVILTTPTVTGD
jgi:cell division protein FtsI/penicillin-binding protein 2